MARRKKREIVDEIVPGVNMTPMIDIVFQLLIYFMLTLKFKEAEGRLLSQLPKDKGLMSSAVTSPELQEVRIFLCAGGDVETHRFNKGKHEEVDKPNDECLAVVEKNELGTLYKTEKYGDKHAHNRALYLKVGEMTAELYNSTPSSRDPSARAPVILDADSEVPYEHIIGVVNACKEKGIDNLEFVGNPRFDSYYGTEQKGQFNRKK